MSHQALSTQPPKSLSTASFPGSLRPGGLVASPPACLSSILPVLQGPVSVGSGVSHADSYIPNIHLLALLSCLKSWCTLPGIQIPPRTALITLSATAHHTSLLYWLCTRRHTLTFHNFTLCKCCFLCPFTRAFLLKQKRSLLVDITWKFGESSNCMLP